MIALIANRLILSRSSMLCPAGKTKGARFTTRPPSAGNERRDESARETGCSHSPDAAWPWGAHGAPSSPHFRKGQPRRHSTRHYPLVSAAPQAAIPNRSGPACDVEGEASPPEDGDQHQTGRMRSRVISASLCSEARGGGPLHGRRMQRRRDS